VSNFASIGKGPLEPSIVVYTCNLSTLEAEAGGSDREFETSLSYTARPCQEEERRRRSRTRRRGKKGGRGGEERRGRGEGRRKKSST
jgi:hypothetical protein